MTVVLLEQASTWSWARKAATGPNTTECCVVLPVSTSSSQGTLGGHCLGKQSAPNTQTLTEEGA